MKCRPCPRPQWVRAAQHNVIGSCLAMPAAVFQSLLQLPPSVLEPLITRRLSTFHSILSLHCALLLFLNEPVAQASSDPQRSLVLPAADEEAVRKRAEEAAARFDAGQYGFFSGPTGAGSDSGELLRELESDKLSEGGADSRLSAGGESSAARWVVCVFWLIYEVIEFSAHVVTASLPCCAALLAVLADVRGLRQQHCWVVPLLC